MKKTSLSTGLRAFLLFILTTSFQLYGQIDFPDGSGFRYLKGKDAVSLSAGWMNSSFDDSGWSLGHAPLRYGDGTGGTVLDDMQNNYTVVYMRTSFSAQNVETLGNISMLIDYDDGFVIWINGKRVLSQYAPAELSYDARSTDLHESGVPEEFVLEPGIADLVEGENTLAIQGFNYNLESTDFLMDLSISATAAPPVLQDTIGLTFSAPSGFYEDPFTLEIVPANPAWKVAYTIDGSNPQVSGTAVIVEGPATILIDPFRIDGRAQTPAFLVRASSVMEGIRPSYPEARTFIFLERVLNQIYPGDGWPDHSVNNQVIDLGRTGPGI
jgi:hypothetical protein